METLSSSFISVIVPTYERPVHVSKCLSALADQQYPRDRFEVLVVDDGGSAPLTGVVNSLRHRLDVTLLRQPHSGPATARNYGAAHAKGSYLAFTDDDCRPSPDWLVTLSSFFRQCPDCVLGGRTLNDLAGNLYSTASQLLVDYLYLSWNSTTGPATFFASNNLALPSHVFRIVGGFDGEWDRAAGEDRDFCDRLVIHGYRLMYVPEALVRHAHVLGVWSFVRQHFNYGWGAHRIHVLRATRCGKRMQFAPLSFYLKAVVYPFTRPISVRKAGLLAILLGLAQAANAVGWLAAGSRHWGKRHAEGIRQLCHTVQADTEKANRGRCASIVSVKRMFKRLWRT
jgi:glycosyltransferase involved in cell wall biosynthesis